FKSYIVAPFPLALAVAMSGLEILFSFIQAYIFTVLSSMYIGAAIHPEH
ncbi:MAG: F0F1 ATP synthase subunit A, partial [Actinobacteria bacterium]|nr:F0F1 ATP synthase subunit A [Actinomycetota bacterium]